LSSGMRQTTSTLPQHQSRSATRCSHEPAFSAPAMEGPLARNRIQLLVEKEERRMTTQVTMDAAKAPSRFRMFPRKYGRDASVAVAGRIFADHCIAGPPALSPSPNAATDRDAYLHS